MYSHSLFRLFRVTLAKQVGLEFHNQFRYYIANTLMPSLMQVVICFTTLLFHITDFQVSGVVYLDESLLLKFTDNVVSS